MIHTLFTAHIYLVAVRTANYKSEYRYHFSFHNEKWFALPSTIYCYRNLCNCLSLIALVVGNVTWPPQLSGDWILSHFDHHPWNVHRWLVKCCIANRITEQPFSRSYATNRSPHYKGGASTPYSHKHYIPTPPLACLNSPLVCTWLGCVHFMPLVREQVQFTD